MDQPGTGRDAGREALAWPGRVRFGALWVDAFTFAGALEALAALVASRRGGAVYTPNVDHVVMAAEDERLRAAYGRCSLSLCDGQPLKWSSPLLGLALPEKVSGSDLVLPAMRLAARHGWRVYLLGGAPGVVEAAAARLAAEEGVTIAGTASPRIGEAPLADEAQVVEAVAAARPDLVLVCLGAPKGELFIDRNRERLGPAVSLSVGASLDFYVGHVRRAPRWMQRAGLEWLFRLFQEPRRMARRYLVRDPEFLAILFRTLREPRPGRVTPPGLRAP
jgi:N-acetylglucosaminyldiphosphoundecaprenol N-acetyl-beta-D-mannosaminyltransferase